MFKCRIKPQSLSNPVIRAILLSRKINHQVLKSKKELPRGVEHGWRDRHNFFTQLWKDSDALLSFLPWWSLKLGITFILLSVHMVISAQGSMCCHFSDKGVNNTTVEICFPFNSGQRRTTAFGQNGSLSHLNTAHSLFPKPPVTGPGTSSLEEGSVPPDSLLSLVSVFTRHKRRQPDKCIKTLSLSKGSQTETLCTDPPPGDSSLI